MKKKKVYKYDVRDHEGVRDNHKPFKLNSEESQKLVDAMREYTSPRFPIFEWSPKRLPIFDE